MRTFRFIDVDGNKYELSQNRIDSALSYIQKRIEYYMPIDVIEAEKLKKTVEQIAIKCTENITPEEAMALVETIKRFVISEIDNAQHYEHYLYDRKGDGKTGNGSEKA